MEDNNPSATTTTTTKNNNNSSRRKKSSSSSYQKVITTSSNNGIGPLRSLFVIVVIVCLTLTVVELRGFGKQQAYPFTGTFCGDDTPNGGGNAGDNVNGGGGVDQPTTSKKTSQKAVVVPPPKLLSIMNHPNKYTYWPTKITNSSLAVIVLSRRDAFKVRKGIRKTWGNTQSNNVYFVVGQGCTVPKLLRGKDEGGNAICEYAPEPLRKNYQEMAQKQHDEEYEIDVRLQQEQDEYGDMIIGQDFYDIYRTLPKKVKTAYKFVYEKLPNVKYALKTDDDFYVRVSEFEKYLHKEYPITSALEEQPMLIGAIMTKNKAHGGGKWREVPQYPMGALYPPFPLGSKGHVVTRPIMKYITEHSHVLFEYQGEDVSMGIWLAPVYGKDIFKDASKVMKNDGNCYDYKTYVVGHDLTRFDMEHCWKYRNETLSTIEQGRIRRKWQIDRKRIIKR